MTIPQTLGVVLASAGLLFWIATLAIGSKLGTLDVVQTQRGASTRARPPF